jgi:hypothetical protein
MLFHPILPAILLILLPPALSVSTITYTIPASTTPPSPQYTSPSTFESSVLDITNHYRSLHSASPVHWNSSLATRGASWAKQCHWRHSGGPTGENLALGYANISAAIYAWYHEATLYSYSDPGFSEATGHFTQLVWRNTTTVGCGVVDCTGKNGLEGYYLVCEYWPPGNVVTADNSQFKANVLEGSDKSGDAGEVDNPTPAASVSSSASATASETSGTPSSTNTAGAGAVTGSLGMSSTVWTILVGVAAVVMAGGMS